jgi:hypothetical protein
MQYRSRITVLGIPLVHVATTEMRDGRIIRGIARGWIALGDISFGILFSAGGIAIGGIALGGLGLGLLTLAGLAMGAFALGGTAVGIVAAGGCAVGWHAALGGAAVAREFAVGGAAVAEHANDAAAREYFASGRFLPGVLSAMGHSRWLVLLVAVPFIHNLIRSRREETPSREKLTG